MRTTLSAQYFMTPKALAESLVDATPEEFAQFWEAFSARIDELADGEKVLHSFAEALSPAMFYAKKRVFKRVCDLISYYEIKAGAKPS